MKASIPLTIVSLALLAGCTAYNALQLPDQPDLAHSLSPQIMGKIEHDRILPDYPVNISDGLDMTTTAIVAVLRNPDLKAARSKVKVAEAEAFSAGLLPDPQLSASLDHPTTAGYINGYNTSLSFDLRAFITRPADVEIAENKQKSLNMEILWQEWQTIQQARNLYAQKYFTAQKLDLLQNTVNLYSIQSSHSSKALKAGDTTLDQAGSDLVALMDARSELNTLQSAALDTDQKLDTLL